LVRALASHGHGPGHNIYSASSRLKRIYNWHHFQKISGEGPAGEGNTPTMLPDAVCACTEPWGTMLPLILLPLSHVCER
jgi:hypothetical protein